MGGTHQDGNVHQIARNIHHLISEKDTSAYVVCKASGVPQSTFYRKLETNPEAFTIHELSRIAAALGVSLAVLAEAA